MKKLVTILTALCIYAGASAFIPSDVVSNNLKTLLQKNFTPVSDVKWTRYQDINVASFRDKEATVSAAYSDDGELLVVGRTIALSQLPEKVSQSLKEKYAGYTMSESAIELTANETWYVVDVQNSKSKMRLKCFGCGRITVESKTKI